MGLLAYGKGIKRIRRYKMTLCIGGVDVTETFIKRGVNTEDVIRFQGDLEDMPFFSPYMASWLRHIQTRLESEELPPLTRIHAIRYRDKDRHDILLTQWVAYSEDESVGWYKYEGLRKGGTRQTLLYHGKRQRMPGRIRMHPRRRRQPRL